MTSLVPTYPHPPVHSRELVPGLTLQVAARLAQKLDVERCRDAAVKPPFIGVLAMIRNTPGVRQGHCAETLGFDATTFGRYIDRLVRDGLVSRSVPPEDRRAVCLDLTDEGRAAIDSCYPVLEELEGDLRRRMGEPEWDQLTVLLERFMDALDHPLPRLRGIETAAE